MNHDPLMEEIHHTRQWAYFHTRARVIAVDLVGHGPGAVWPVPARSIAHAAHRIHQLLTQLETGPAVLVGISMGAAVALQLAWMLLSSSEAWCC